MDLELPASNALSVPPLQPIHLLPSSLLQQHPSLLENSFSTTSHCPHPEYSLTLFPNALLVSSLHPSDPQPLAFLEFAFQLKFEILYCSEKNVKSGKRGLRFCCHKGEGFTVYSSPAVVQAWSICLSLHLNQIGFHEMFKPLKKLGKGNFASVYEVERTTDRRRFAVKAFSKQSCFSAKKGKESLMNELGIMRRLSSEGHANLLRLEGVFESQNSIYVVLELLAGGQLLHRIKERKGCFCPEEVRELMLGLLGGLAQMHAGRIMHRDLKPENIMLRSTLSLSPVIVDYGLATLADLPHYLFYRCGTPGYVAPEIIALKDNTHVEPQCDVFSAGAIFHILLTRRPLFEGTQYEEVYRKNKEMKFTLEGQAYQDIDPQALSLLRSMLLADPEERITAAEALSHPYFNGQCASELKVTSPVATSCGRGEWRWVGS